ncbi:MAG: AAA family ATPase, partial [Egibacteraceae bacterium]
AHRFVAVIGPSGAGKSSLVQAGLIPRLAQQRSRWVVAPPLVPTDQPTKSLARSLASALPGTQVDVLEVELAGDSRALVRCAEQLRAAAGGRSVLVVVDQAEELVTRAGGQERAGFLALLRAALQEDSRLWVVVTLRSEFLTGFLTSGFSDLFRNPVVIGALDRAALFQAIEGPAAQADLRFTPGVVNALVDDTGGGDALPLLAYILQALYLRVGSGRTVTAEDYRRLGGVAGALSQQADRVTAELQAADPDAPVLSTLLKFVTVDESELTRRRVRRSTLTGGERGVVDAFVAARLLTSDAEGDDGVIEVAHEALFRRWPPLRQAIEARADELRQRAELERWAQDWVRS